MIELSPEIITILMLGGILVGVMVGYPLGLVNTGAVDRSVAVYACVGCVSKLCPPSNSPVRFHGAHASTFRNSRENV